MREHLFYILIGSLQGSQAQCKRKEKSQWNNSTSHMTFPKEEEMSRSEIGP